jgi:NitT/TauT family transport system ATP-binding protein
VEQVIEADLPRPRGLAARKNSAFTDAVDMITEIFLARGVLHSGPAKPTLVGS